VADVGKKLRLELVAKEAVGTTNDTTLLQPKGEGPETQGRLL